MTLASPFTPSVADYTAAPLLPGTAYRVVAIVVDAYGNAYANDALDFVVTTKGVKVCDPMPQSSPTCDAQVHGRLHC
jgi:hypothetical protein